MGERVLSNNARPHRLVDVDLLQQQRAHQVREQEELESNRVVDEVAD